MQNVVPGYLTPLVLSETAATITAALLGLDRALQLSALPLRDRHRAFWSGSALLLSWLVAALVLSWLGFYQGAGSRIPTIQFGLLVPIVAGVWLFHQWPLLRRIVELVPQRWIVTIQFYRALGFIFLVLHGAGLLPGVFAHPAGFGDVTVGLLAPFVGLAYARGWRGSTGLVRAWNLLGLADLVVAVSTGFLTSPSPVLMLALDRPNQLIAAFPLVMIPVFLVPLAVLLHLASLQKLQRSAA